MKVLITAGGSEEPIDGVRRLTNLSTGATGAALARHFAARGADVLLLHAERAAVGAMPCPCETFVTVADLEAVLRRLLARSRWDAVLHLAAVSDYAVDAVEVDGVALAPGARGKIDSGHEVVLRLRPNPKLIDGFRSWSANPTVRVVGFKLTDELDQAKREAQVQTLLARGVADLVVHNDLSEIVDGRHRASIYDRTGLLQTVETKETLARALYEWVGKGVRA